MEANFVLNLRRADHPKNRSSYGVPGNPGIVVFDNGLFADGVPPATVMVNVALVAPKASASAEKAEAARLKAEEKAKKAEEKAAAAKAKAEKKAADAQAKADAALAKANAKKAQADAAAQSGAGTEAGQ